MLPAEIVPNEIERQSVTVVHELLAERIGETPEN
jgi:hypothetical protein